MTRTRKTLLTLVAIATPILVGGFVIQERATRDGVRLFEQVMSIVGDRFVDSVSASALYEKAARGLLKELKDPYTELYTPKQLEAFNTTTGGFYGGVGMLIEEQEGSIVISKVYPHTPAEEAGIHEGDKIIQVDTSSTRGWKIDQVSSRLKGEPGTKVTAKFARPGWSDPITATFTRRVIRIPAIPFGIMLDGKIGYVPVQNFNETSSPELAQQIIRLQSEGAKGLVVDLRGNPGGFLDQALEMSNLFLARGQEILSVRDRQGISEQHKAERDPVAPKLPLVILTDGYSASASEIVAGALQDHDRALVVGTTSFGKGLVQSVYRLDGGYAIKLTTGKWYTPSGRSIQKERKLLDDGQFVEVRPDSMESDSVRKARPRFKSDAGRVVFGGGAITPDLIIPYDTLTSVEQKVAKALGMKGQDTYITLYDYAFEEKGKVKPDFVVTPAMRDEFYNRLQKKGVVVDRKDYDAAQDYINRLIDTRISRLAFGDSTAKRREVSEDIQLMKALDLLRKGQTQRDLFALTSPTTPPSGIKR
jgi:carboxyl-terminal processing protease